MKLNNKLGFVLSIILILFGIFLLSLDNDNYSLRKNEQTQSTEQIHNAQQQQQQDAEQRINSNILIKTSLRKQKRYLPGMTKKAYSEEYVSVDEVQKDLLTQIKINNKTWTQNQIDDVSKIIAFGNNNSDFRIPYKVVISIISHESHMKIREKSPYPNRDGTIDYGLGQHNSNYIYERFAYARRINRKYDILSEERFTGSVFDQNSSVLATILYLKDNRDELDSFGKRYGRHISFEKWIISYNSGVNGVIENLNDSNYRKVYYVKVMESMDYIL